MRDLRFMRVGCLAAGLALLWSGWAAASTGGSGWSVQRTPNPKRPPDSYLLDVSCASARACTALGESDNVAGTKSVPLVEHWNGKKWKIEQVPTRSRLPQTTLNGVFCAAASDCFAVGVSYDRTTAVTLAERWNGTRWRIQRTPNAKAPESSVLHDIFCLSANSCLAVGDSNTTDASSVITSVPLVERWDGQKWTIQPTPPADSDVSRFLSVSCTSANACTAIGDSGAGMMAERWDGTEWTIQPLRYPKGADESELVAVSCASARECIAVGDATYYKTEKVLAERWDGSKWTIQHVPARGGTWLGDVSCTSATACTAVGNDNGTPLAAHWNGHRWKAAHAPAHTDTAYLQGVSCISRRRCAAVGSYRTDATRRFLVFDRTLAERWTR
jgi:hypothetical protein